MKSPAERALTDLTIAEVGLRIRNRDVSPLEVLEATLGRIEDRDGQLNSYIRRSADSARAAAKGAERLISAGYYLGPLHGVPIGLKDLVAVRGEVCSAGSKILADYVPEEDSTVAARLRAAGAIFTGRLNMHEFAYGVTTNNPHYGPTRNPWKLDRSPGGSSGGSGAAVAARLCYGAIGTDTGCSVRLPAAFNGITGIRPTIGRVSNYGITPLAWTLDTAGPMCRTAEDCAVMLRCIAGYDYQDSQTENVPVPDYAADLDLGLDGVRVAIVEDFTLSGLQDGVRSAVEDALHQLENGGAQIREVSLQGLAPAVSAVLTVDIAEPAAYHAAWLRARPEDYGEDVRGHLEAGELYLATHYIQAQRFRSLIRDEFSELFRGVDVVVTPTVPFTAPPIEATDITLDSGETLDVISAVMRYNALPPLTGMPAASIPCGFAEDGLPVGMQLIGDRFDESTVLRVGHSYQNLTDWHTRAPEG